MKLETNYLALYVLLALSLLFNARAELNEKDDDIDHDDRKTETIIVKTKLGLMRGAKEVVSEKFAYYAFKGIKYAKPPKRFEAPEPVDAWDGTVNALRDGDLCPQFSIAANRPVGNENCLVLNVYTRSVTGSRAVIVYLHGGAFITGGGVSYYFGPKLLLEQDVVLVTVQYRLGAFGFLSTGDNRASGNWGLLDQLSALRWIQANIKAFGGDPQSVTLLGEDSGAASATMLTLSPLAEGLFHKVIALSGNALCAQYMQGKPKEAAMELIRRLECPDINVEEGLECLRSKPVGEIILKSNDMHIFYSFPRWFSPVVDGIVLLSSPEKTLSEGSFHHVPTIVGQTKEEGAFFYRLTLNTLSNGRYDDTFIEKFTEILPMMSELDRKLLPLSGAMRRRYFRNVDLEQESQFRPKFIELLTDLLYTRCTEKYASFLANNSVPTYRYVFEYRGQYSIVNLQGEVGDLGVAHGDDLQYVFNDIWGSEYPMSDEDLVFSRTLFVPLLVNFSKYSTPTPNISENLTTVWTPFSRSKTRLLRIGSKLSVESNYRSDFASFWNEEVPTLLRSPTLVKKDPVAPTSNYLHRQEL